MLELRGVDDGVIWSKEGEGDGDEDAEADGGTERCPDGILLKLGKEVLAPASAVV